MLALANAGEHFQRVRIIRVDRQRLLEGARRKVHLLGVVVALAEVVVAGNQDRRLGPGRSPQGVDAGAHGGQVAGVGRGLGLVDGDYIFVVVGLGRLLGCGELGRDTGDILGGHRRLQFDDRLARVLGQLDLAAGGQLVRFLLGLLLFLALAAGAAGLAADRSLRVLGLINRLRNSRRGQGQGGERGRQCNHRTSHLAPLRPDRARFCDV